MVFLWFNIGIENICYNEIEGEGRYGPDNNRRAQ